MSNQQICHNKSKTSKSKLRRKNMQKHAKTHTQNYPWLKTSFNMSIDPASWTARKHQKLEPSKQTVVSSCFLEGTITNCLHICVYRNDYTNNLWRLNITISRKLMLINLQNDAKCSMNLCLPDGQPHHRRFPNNCDHEPRVPRFVWLIFDAFTRSDYVQLHAPRTSRLDNLR